MITHTWMSFSVVSEWAFVSRLLQILCFWLYILEHVAKSICRVLNADADSVHVEDTSDKKKRKKKKNKKKNQESGEDVNKDQAVSAAGDGAKSTLESQDKQSSGKSSQVRTFANGLVIEELAMGKPDGKRASPGCQVTPVWRLDNQPIRKPQYSTLYFFILLF